MTVTELTLEPGSADRSTSNVIPARNKEPKSARQASRNVPKGWFRRQMFQDFDKAVYALRCLVETVNSMVKRKMGDIV